MLNLNICEIKLYIIFQKNYLCKMCYPKPEKDSDWFRMEDFVFEQICQYILNINQKLILSYLCFVYVLVIIITCIVLINKIIIMHYYET